MVIPLLLSPKENGGGKVAPRPEGADTERETRQ